MWPAWWWLELLHYLPFPVLLGPALIALFASLLLGRWARGLALLSVLLVLSVVMGLALGRADAGSGRLRVMTYNAKAYLAEERPGGFERLVAEVQRHDPDLLVMQDAGELTEQRDKAPASVAPLFDRRSVYTVGQYIIVSRLPLRDCHTQDITHGVHDQQLARCTPHGPWHRHRRGHHPPAVAPRGPECDASRAPAGPGRVATETSSTASGRRRSWQATSRHARGR